MATTSLSSSATAPPELQTDPSTGETPADSAPVPSEILSPGSAVNGTPSTDPVVTELQRPTTHLQQGIRKPKTYTDGTMQWCMHTSTSTEEPTTLDEAIGDQNWVAAMNSEHQALLWNKTWHLVPCPKGKNVIGCKWVYKVKRKADGTVDWYKACLVAKGFNSITGSIMRIHSVPLSWLQLFS